jgi:hypothetical protein
MMYGQSKPAVLLLTMCLKFRAADACFALGCVGRMNESHALTPNKE